MDTLRAISLPTMYYLPFLYCLLLTATAHAQANFSATWPFDGNPNGSTNQPNIGTGGADFVGVGPSTIAQYVTGSSGQAVNVQNWTVANCNFSEYVSVTVQPLNGQKLTLTSLSFFFERSDAGPQEIRVRSSLDNFGSDIHQQNTSDNYQQANVNLGNTYSNLSVPVTFHIHACRLLVQGGTLHLDQVVINGTITNDPLPVTLLSFTAKSEGNRVQLAWATTAERDADRFVVERSADLREYVSVGEVAAKGTTDTRQYYGLTDTNPLPGANYYRLRQMDRDGTVHTFKPVSAVVAVEDVVAVVYPNPADPTRIHLRLWNADDAALRLLTLTGQPVESRLERRLGEADLIPLRPLPSGVYLLEVQTNGQKRVNKVLVR